MVRKASELRNNKRAYEPMLGVDNCLNATKDIEKHFRAGILHGQTQKQKACRVDSLSIHIINRRAVEGSVPLELTLSLERLVGILPRSKKNKPKKKKKKEKKKGK